MIINKAKLVELIASSDLARMHLCHPHLDVAKQVLVATNGKAMAVVNVTVEPRDVSGPVPLAALKEARKIAKKDICYLGCRKRAVLVNRLAFPRYGAPYGPEADNFPPWEVVTVRPKEPTFIVALDVRLLVKVAKAINADLVVMEVVPGKDDCSSLDAIRVYGTNDTNEDYAILMPCRAERRNV